MARKAADAGTPDAHKKTRAYHSPRRQEQANVTKQRIVSAAMQLVKEKGYADMTLESIAREAGVAPQTVYAVCGSKKGVLAAILETTVEAKQYDKLRDHIPTIKNPRERVREMARFHALLLRDAMPVFDIMRGMSVLSPEFAEQEHDQSMMLFEKCRQSVQMMANEGMLRPGLSVERAAEMYWAFGTPGMHRRLTLMLGWSTEEYAAFLSYLLGTVLLGDEPTLPFLNEGEHTSVLNKVMPDESLLETLPKKKTVRRKKVAPAEASPAEADSAAPAPEAGEAAALAEMQEAALASAVAVKVRRRRKIEE